MTNRQQITKCLAHCDAMAAQFRKSGDIEMARKYEREALALSKELAAIDTAALKALLAK